MVADRFPGVVRESLQWQQPRVPLCRRCGGTGSEGDEACEFRSATGRGGQLEDALSGSIWWNSISRAERLAWRVRHWLRRQPE